MMCVCVYVCARARARMTGNVFAEDGLIIRLWKRLILFHITSCYPLRRFRPQLR